MADDLASKASDFLKKVVTAGVGAVFLTEEGLKALMGELKLPKELLVSLLKSANDTRREFLQNMSQDVMNKIVSKVNVEEVLSEFLRKNEVDLQIRVRFSARDKTPEAEE
jgi:hypothetical protein